LHNESCGLWRLEKTRLLCIYGKEGSKIAPSDSLLKEAKRAAKSKKENEQNKAKRTVTKR